MSKIYIYKWYTKLMLTHLRLEKKMDDAISEILPNTFFKNKSEFIRDSIRKNLEYYSVFAKLEKIKGSSKGFAPSLSQRQEYFKEFENEVRD